MNKSLNAFHLKVIAIIAMLINHIGHGFSMQEAYYGFYAFSLFIGNLTFPIMAYLLVEGYRYTRDVKRYALRLALFWILSIVPFWMCFYYPTPFTAMQLVNNIMFTLLMGLLLLIVTDRVDSAVLRGVLVLLFTCMTVLSDWPIIGVLMIYGFHRIKEPRRKCYVPVLYTFLFSLTLVGLMLFSANATDIEMGAILMQGVAFLGLILVIPLLLSYNGQRGYCPPWVKWGFYIFYPTHLLILGFLNM